MSWSSCIAIPVLLLAGACNRPFRERPHAPSNSATSPANVRTGSIDGEITSSGVIRHYILHVRRIMPAVQSRFYLC